MNKEDNPSNVLNSKRTGVAIDTHSGVYGEYTAGGIKCKESAIKAVVARVHLSRLNYNDYIANKAKYLQTTTNKKKGVKRKLRESLSQENNNTSQGENQVAKKGRGRPRKVQATTVSSVLHANLKSNIDSVKKKERPKKEENETMNKKSKLKPDLDKVKRKILKIKRLKRFNGDKNPIIINSVRVRKPNPKFQDFIVSSDVPFYAPSSVESSTKEKKEPIKIKPKPKLSKPNPKLQDFVVSSDISLFAPSSVELPTKEKIKIKIKPKPKLPKLVDVTEVVPQDPLDISIGDDVVRSFLPVFDAPPQSGNILILKNQHNATGPPIIIAPNKRFKEKENLVNNRQPKLIKKDITPKPESQSSNASKLIKRDATPKPESQSSIASKLLKKDTTLKPESQSSIASKLIKKDTTSKPESQSSNASKLIKKDTAPKPESQSSNTDVSDYSPPKLRNRSNSKPSTPLLKPPSLKVSPDLKVYSNKHKICFQKSKEQKKRINNSVTPQNKPRLEKIDSDVEIPVAVKENNITKAIPDTPKSPKAKTKQTKTKTNENCSNNATKPKKNVSYVLVDSDNFPNRTKVSKSGDVDFNKLVRSLKSIKLPGAKWKIRIVVSRQQTISEVTFTNKEVNERCVKFSRTFTGYVITFGKSEVTLLGAPSKISSFNDVSILLDIVHNISSNDPVLEYCTSKNV